MTRPTLYSFIITSAAMLFCITLVWQAKWPDSFNRVAAEIGNAQSQYLLGAGIVRNEQASAEQIAEGIEYIQRASDQGHVKAPRLLADQALKRGDIYQALDLYQEASRRGDADAVLALANIYSTATHEYPGILKDNERAERYEGFIKRFYFGNECWPVDNFDAIFPLPPASLPDREEQTRLRQEGCRR